MNSMNMKKLLLPLGALAALCSLASAQLVLHQWTFDETVGTAINATANTGSGATAGAPTWGALVNSVAGTDWATTGTGALRLAANNPDNVDTLVQSVVTMPGLSTGIIRFEWDLSWDLDSRPGNVQETFLINRNQGGSNRFRWTVGQLTGTGNPGMYLAADVGVANTTLNGNMGASGNVVLRTDFSFVAGAVTAVSTAYSLNGAAFVDGPGTANATLVGTGNLNDLRIHSKGRFDSDNYLDFNSVTVTAVPEPATMALLAGLCVLGLVVARRRR
jgi:hypothetical protein